MTQEMAQQIDTYYDEDRHEEIVQLILEVPEEERDIEMLGQLVVAYNNLERYEDAVVLSMELKEESKESIAWHYRIGYAMVHMGEYKKAAEYLDRGMELINKQNNTSELSYLKELYVECLPYLDTGDLKSWKEEPLEIVWSEETDEYIVSKGAVELGYFGKFHAYQMSVGFNEYDYEDVLSDDDDEYADLKNYLSENMNHEEIAKGLTEYFNYKLDDIKKHIIEINQALLAYIMDDMIGSGYPFWEECTSYVIPDKMPSEDADDMENAIYKKEVTKEHYELFDKYYETAMNGEVDTKTYVEDFLERKMPMFDYKKMLKDVYSEYLNMDVRGISAQCSGAGEALKLVCAACVEIQNDNSFYDWHNHQGCEQLENVAPTMAVRRYFGYYDVKCTKGIEGKKQKPSLR